MPTDTVPQPDTAVDSADNTRLSVKRERETPEYAAFMRRAMRAYARRVTDSDLVDLAELVAMRDELDAVIQAAIDGHRTRWGTSWTEIGRALGITRQAARQRWGRP